MKKTLLFTFLLSFSISLSAQTIVDIQGNGDVSPYDGQIVTTTGIVTAIAPQGYFIQDGFFYIIFVHNYMFIIVFLTHGMVYLFLHL